MTRVDNAIDIQAPRDKVFAFIADVEAQPEWVKWAKRVEVTSQEKAAVGATDTMLMQVGPQKKWVDGLITEVRPGHTIARRFTSGMDLTERLSVVDTSEGTKLAYSVEYTPPMGAMGKAMDALFMSRLFDQLMKDSLTNAKERLEA